MPVEGEMALRRIPVALTSGWGGLEDAALPMPLTSMPRSSGLSARAINVLDAFAATDMDAMETGGAPAMPLRPASARRVGRRMLDALSGTSRRSGADAQRPLDRVVALQRADGSWDLTSEFAAAVGVNLKHLAAGVSHVAGADDARRLWATLVALAWLARHADDARDEWRLLARKAERWVSAAAGGAETLRTWQRAAVTLIAG